MGRCRDAAMAIERGGFSMTVRSHPAAVLSLAAGVLGDFRRLFVPLATFEILFKSAVAILSIAGGALLLAILVRFTGTSAVTNTDIVDFLLSPVGVLVVAMLGLSAPRDHGSRAPRGDGDRGAVPARAEDLGAGNLGDPGGARCPALEAQGQGPGVPDADGDTPRPAGGTDVRRAAVSSRHQLLPRRPAGELSGGGDDRRRAGGCFPCGSRLPVRPHGFPLSDHPLRGLASTACPEGKPEADEGGVPARWGRSSWGGRSSGSF